MLPNLMQLGAFLNSARKKMQYFYYNIKDWCFIYLVVMQIMHYNSMNKKEIHKKIIDQNLSGWSMQQQDSRYQSHNQTLNQQNIKSQVVKQLNNDDSINYFLYDINNYTKLSDNAEIVNTQKQNNNNQSVKNKKSTKLLKKNRKLSEQYPQFETSKLWRAKKKYKQQNSDIFDKSRQRKVERIMKLGGTLDIAQEIKSKKIDKPNNILKSLEKNRCVSDPLNLLQKRNQIKVLNLFQKLHKQIEYRSKSLKKSKKSFKYKNHNILLNKFYHSQTSGSVKRIECLNCKKQYKIRGERKENEQKIVSLCKKCLIKDKILQIKLSSQIKSNKQSQTEIKINKEDSLDKKQMIFDREQKLRLNFYYVNSQSVFSTKFNDGDIHSEIQNDLQNKKKTVQLLNSLNKKKVKKDFRQKNNKYGKKTQSIRKKHHNSDFFNQIKQPSYKEEYAPRNSSVFLRNGKILNFSNLHIR